MAVYVVRLREQTTDASALAEYGPKAALSPQNHPLKPLSLYGAIEAALLLEFPDMTAARACYDRPSD
jgi:uncharacterized protein (DUF1330 family)